MAYAGMHGETPLLLRALLADVAWLFIWGGFFIKGYAT